MENMGCVPCGVHAPCCPLWCLFVPSSEGLATGAWGLDAVYLTGRPGGGDGAKSRQRPGCALGENPNLGFSATETAGAWPPRSHKGNFVWLPMGGGAQTLPGNRAATSEPQLAAMITPVTLDLRDRADTRPDGHVWDKPVLCASGPALSDPDLTHCFLEN